jgi:hypothetical protein
MGYSEQPIGLSKRQFVIVGGFLALLIALASVVFHVTTMPDYASRTDVETAVQQHPRIAATATVLKQIYPAAYAKIMSEQLGEVEIEQLDTRLVGGFLSGLSTFLRSKKAVILRAPDAHLAAIATARSTMISRLAVTSIGACASYSQFAMSPGWEAEDISKSLASDVDVALLRAAKAGEGLAGEAQVDATRPALIDAPTQAALKNATARRGMTAAQRIIQRNENSIGLRESERTRCIAGMLYFRSIADLPPRQAATIIAHDLRHSPLLGSAPTK